MLGICLCRPRYIAAAKRHTSKQEKSINTELTYLVWVTLLTAIIWIPYILDRMLK